MCKLVLGVGKAAPLRDVREIMELIGELFVANHRWKVQVRRADKPTPYAEEKLITGHELHDLVRQDIRFNEATFSALEGDQILFRITCGEKSVVHTTRRHWVEFFEEKFNIEEKTELDVEEPEVAEFMQD